MKNKLFAFLVALAASTSLWAQSGTCGDNLTWLLSNGILTISGSGDMTNYVNNSYNSAPWYWCTSPIYTVVIGDSVTSIGNDAFVYCSRLTSVTIPNSLISIGTNAFYGCDSISSIQIQDLTSWCNIEGLENLMRYGRPKTMLLGSDTIRSLTIPNSVTSIGDNAFYNCVNTIDVYCSANPSHLTWVNPNSGFKENKATLFHVYDSLAWVTAFPTANVTFVGDLALHNLQKLLDHAMDLYDNSVEGSETGQYQTGSRAELYASISAVSAQITDDMTSEQINSCIDQMNAAIELFQSRRVETDLPALGDINEDGVVNVMDATALIGAYLQGTTDQLNANIADVNHDGIINVMDATEIINIYLHNR